MSVGWFRDSVELVQLSKAQARQRDALIASALATIPKAKDPRLIHFCGIPGSGKTTEAEKLYRTLNGFYYLQFDAVMVGLNEYADLRANVGSAKAYEQLVLPARSIGYQLLEALVNGRRSILFDHGGSFPEHVELCREAQDWGYWVELHHVKCDVATATERVRKRNATSDRAFPLEEIPQRAKIIDELLPLYVSAVDRYVVVPSG